MSHALLSGRASMKSQDSDAGHGDSLKSWKRWARWDTMLPRSRVSNGLHLVEGKRHRADDGRVNEQERDEACLVVVRLCSARWIVGQAGSSGRLEATREQMDTPWRRSETIKAKQREQ